MGYDKRVRPNYGGKFSTDLSPIYICSANAQLGTNMGLVTNKGPQFGQIQIKSYHTNHVKATHNFFLQQLKLFPTQTMWPRSFFLHLWHPFWCLTLKRIRLPSKRKFGQKSEEKGRNWRSDELPEKKNHQPINHALFFSFLGTAVTVGVTMFVLSISELSEVGMVRKKEIFYSVNYTIAVP